MFDEEDGHEEFFSMEIDVRKGIKKISLENTRVKETDVIPLQGEGSRDNAPALTSFHGLGDTKLSIWN